MPDSSSNGIFLSYRREDATAYARLLHSEFTGRFPDAPVFMDLDSIEPGLDFAEVIEEKVNSCAVLVVLIGRQWATLADEGGHRRLDDPDDFVRSEVQTALERGVRVIPVLVDGARPLRRQELPDELQKLARLNALELSSVRYQYDADRLFDVIRGVLGAVKAQEEAERKAEQKAREEAGRKAQEEAERRAQEEAERKAEQKAREEAGRKAQEEAERRAQEEAGRKVREEAEQEAREEGVAVPQRLRVFINYRRDDTWAPAELLYDRLANAFGSENIFLDTRNLQPAMNWLQEIKSHRDSCSVLLALIGPSWMSIMHRHQQQAREPAEDYVRFELEYALKASSGIHVIPVLLGDDVPFRAEGLPRSLRPLTNIEVEQVRQKRFEADIAHLIDRLKTIIREQSTHVPGPAPQSSRMEGQTHHSGSTTSIAPAPGISHFSTILQHLAEGNLVPFLGSSLMVGHPGRPGGAPSPFDARELAADLAQRFGITPARPELPEVAQYVYVTRGKQDLYQALRRILTTEYEPGPVHRFLACLPQKLEERGFENRYQLIVSTNFDRALEESFDDGQEPYDLVMYMASGPDKGRFVHFPYDGAPVPIVEPNSYGRLPIGDYGELARTVIVKMLGGVDGNVGGYRWRENYVITEDDYIDYLSRSPIENLVPVQILEKLSDSHCLFLGYPGRDQSLRVVLKRIWRGEPIGAKSWAIEPSPDALEKDFWALAHVDVYAADLAHYVGQLDQQLTSTTRPSWKA